MGDGQINDLELRTLMKQYQSGDPTALDELVRRVSPPLLRYFSSSRFGRDDVEDMEGWPCAAMELTIVIPATALLWILARKGALFASAGLGATLTGLAVFLVLIPLQFQCMFQQAPHLLLWHGGTALLMIGLGALTGSLWRGRQIS
jgi:hypothetical protein